MFINIFHRPKPGRLHPFYRMQQDMAHEAGLKVTLTATYAAMQDPQAVDEMKRDHQEHGDEIGLLFGEFHCPQFMEKVNNLEFSYWLYGLEDKKRIAEMFFEKFRECFGHDPVSVAAYVLDASSLNLIKEMCPSVKGGIAACFEEGVSVFHGCNHSWYLFNEGGPWGPWYPSKNHTLRPAEDKDDWVGIVAVNHLARDMVHSFEGRNDFYNTHPQNVMRGKGNDGQDCPYSLNLIDQYLSQEELNNGFSYLNLFVGANWLTHSMNFEEEPEVAQKLYRESLEYLAELKGKGKVTDMSLSEFAEWFTENRPIGTPEVYLAREILYGSGKHYVWYIDPKVRVLIDTTQGGSIGDLRPYAAQLDGATGPDTPRLLDGAYPFLIQSQRRAGLANHSFDGTRTTLQVACNGETKDLGIYRTKCASIETDEEGTHVRLTPVKLSFKNGVTAYIETIYHFPGEGKVIIERKVKDASDLDAELTLTEYFKGCYGTTEYAQEMSGIKLSVHGSTEEEIEYAYKCRTVETKDALRVLAQIPQISTEVSLEVIDGPAETGKVIEGFLFNPFFTLTLSKTIKSERSIKTCLTVAKLQ